MFDKLFRDSAAELRDQSAAVKLLEVAAKFTPKYDLLTRLVTELGLRRVVECITFATDVAFVRRAVLPFLASLRAPELSRGTCTLPLRKLLHTIWDAPGFVDNLLALQCLHELSDADWRAVSWCLIQDIHTRNENALRLARALVDCALPEARQLALLLDPGAGASLPAAAAAAPLIHFRDESLVPLANELDRAPFLPPQDTDARAEGKVERSAELHHREAYLLERQFRLLREDMLGAVREVLDPKAKRRVLRFSNVRVLALKCSVEQKKEDGGNGHRNQVELGLEIALGFPKEHRICTLKTPKERAALVERSKRLLPRGSLVCVCRADRPLAFAVVADRNVDGMATNPVDFTISVTTTPPNLSVLLELAAPVDGEPAAPLGLVTASASYFAYEPILRSLQNMDYVPFAEEFVHYWGPQPLERPAELPDSVAAGVASLDPSQASAVYAALEQRVVLIQGPPGTGKTHVGSLLAKALFDAEAHQQLLCVCYTNHALDQFLERLLACGVPHTSVVRLGGGSKSERIKQLMLPRGRERLGHAEHQRRLVLQDVMAQQEQDIMNLQELLRRPLSLRDVVRELPFDHPARTLLLPEGEEERGAEEGPWRLVGARGQLVKPDYLLDVWLQGRQPDASLLQAGYEAVPALWARSRVEREGLLAQWRREVRATTVEELQLAMRLYETAFEERKALLRAADAVHLQAKRVIGCTTSGASIYKELLDEAAPAIVIVEEAAEILEAHVLTSVSKRCERLIMIGDHKQLRPKIEVHALSVESGRGHNLNCSLFERLAVAGFPVSTLTTQHRMRPELSQIIRKLTYPLLLDHEDVHALPRAVRGLQRPFVVVNHDEKEDAEDGAGGEERSLSKVNSEEVELTVRIVRYLHQQGYKAGDMVVLTPYLGQLLALRKAIADLPQLDAEVGDRDRRDLAAEGVFLDADANAAGRKPQRRESVRVSTIDNYQGEEANLVIASLVRSNSRGTLGFLCEPERVNVLFSRARFGMIVVANVSTFRIRADGREKGSAMWREMLGLIDPWVHDGLPIRCERHGTARVVRSRESFEQQCPDGGCAMPCGERLGCQHVCPLRCHVFDQEHRTMRCQEIVATRCPAGHVIERVCSAGAAAPSCGICKELERLARAHTEAVRKAATAARKRQDELEVARQRAEQQRLEAEQQLRDERAEREARARVRVEELEAERLERLRKLRVEHATDELAAREAQLLADNQKELDELRTRLERERQDFEQKAAKRVADAQREVEETRRRLERDLARRQREAEEQTARAQQRLEVARAAAEQARAAAEAKADAAERQAVEDVAAQERRVAAAAAAAVAAAAVRAEAVRDDAARLRLARAMKECCICGDACAASEGLQCRGAVPHFLCAGCLTGLVKTDAEAELRVLEQRNALVRCPLARHGCASEPFADNDLALYLPAEAFQIYLAARGRLLEARIGAAIEVRMRQELQAEQERLRRLSVAERAADDAVKHVREDLLTLKCPRAGCRQAFADFDGCCALTCSRCGCGFCAWCLEDCGDDAHRHVANCAENPMPGRQVYGTEAAFHECQRRRRLRLVQAHLATLQPDVRAAAERSLAPNLRDLGQR